MSNHTTLKLLFTTLQGTLPYEYDEKYLDGTGLEDTIIISKTSPERSIYVTKNTPYENAVFDLTLYDDTIDDNPIETSQWDADDPNLTLIDLITYIKKSL